jgi:hypothetical protein
MLRNAKLVLFTVKRDLDLNRFWGAHSSARQSGLAAVRQIGISALKQKSR